MPDLVLTTFDWVPELPRGFVRDIRIRWALEEAGLPYRVATVPFRERRPEHFARQPFGQVPFLEDGALCIFETGAILLHLGNRSEVLLPADARARSDAVCWLFAALNSLEVPSVPWSLYRFAGDTADTPGRRMLDGFLDARLRHGRRAAPRRPVRRPRGPSRLPGLRRPRYCPALLREGPRRPACPFRRRVVTKPAPRSVRSTRSQRNFAIMPF
jgi:glutathione S-transferase